MGGVVRGRGFGRVRVVARGVVAAVLCVVVVSCSPLRGAGGSASATRTGSVVSSVAPTDPAAEWCAGLSQEALVAMFGPDATPFTRTSLFAIPNAECQVGLSGRADSVFVGTFGYLYGDHDLWDSQTVVSGGDSSAFSFEGVEGSGEALMNDRKGRVSGTTVFTCGDHYLLLTVMGNPEMNGDTLANFVSLTQSTLPWLCQGETVPGFGATMEEMRPAWATDAPTEPAEPTGS